MSKKVKRSYTCKYCGYRCAGPAGLHDHYVLYPDHRPGAVVKNRKAYDPVTGQEDPAPPKAKTPKKRIRPLDHEKAIAANVAAVLFGGSAKKLAGAAAPVLSGRWSAIPGPVDLPRTSPLPVPGPSQDGYTSDPVETTCIKDVLVETGVSGTPYLVIVERRVFDIRHHITLNSTRAQEALAALVRRAPDKKVPR